MGSEMCIRDRHELNQFLEGRSGSYGLDQLQLSRRLMHADGSCNAPLISAVVLHVGQFAIATPASSLAHSPPMELFQRLGGDLAAEGRYLFLNAIANQLRYPNNHTHYFSCVLLYLFSEAPTEAVQEQITRVLVERLIVHRPHPWGLLITFIELIKNPRYNFWSKPFTRCAPEIERLFESVARSCMAAPSGQNSSGGAVVAQPADDAS